MGYSVYHHAKSSFYLPASTKQYFDKHFLLIWENSYIQSVLTNGLIYRKDGGKTIPYIALYDGDDNIKNWLLSFDNEQPFVLSFRKLEGDDYGFVIAKVGRK